MLCVSLSQQGISGSAGRTSVLSLGACKRQVVNSLFQVILNESEHPVGIPLFGIIRCRRGFETHRNVLPDICQIVVIKRPEKLRLGFQVEAVFLICKGDCIDMVKHLVGAVNRNVMLLIRLCVELAEIVVGEYELAVFGQFAPSGIANTVVGHAVELGIYVARPGPLAVKHVVNRHQAFLGIFFSLPEIGCVEAVAIFYVEVGIAARRHNGHHQTGCQ